MSSSEKTPQARFDETYITAAQILKDFKISRSALLHARRRGLLPDSIVCNDGKVYLWEREKVQPYLTAWKLIRDVRNKKDA